MVSDHCGGARTHSSENFTLALGILGDAATFTELSIVCWLECFTSVLTGSSWCGESTPSNGASQASASHRGGYKCARQVFVHKAATRSDTRGIHPRNHTASPRAAIQTLKATFIGQIRMRCSLQLSRGDPLQPRTRRR
jgi:hypothetical protein